MAESVGTFWDHLDALRGVVMKVVVVVAVIAIAAFCAMPWLFDAVVLAPCRPDFPLYRLLDYMSARGHIISGINGEPFSLEPVSLQLTTQFMVHLSASCWTAAIVGFPIIIYLLWGFVSPALYEREKRGIRRAFVLGNLMFYVGVATGYFIVFPLVLRFLATYQLSESIATVVSLDSYMDNFYTLILVMGAMFELPLLAWMLGKMGLVGREFFRRYRRHAVVVLLIVAAMITPTGDPFTLLVVFVPLYALWELSASMVPKKEA